SGRERILAFARASEEGLYLVLANFSSEQVDIALPLPAEFFAATGITEGTAFRAADQLTGAVDFLCLTTLAPLRLSLAPHGLQILRLTAV
ncbi:MAG: alpha amylase, partial [Porphyromonas sp.]|nr:alpha amylase [Porphyromonas sp.]